MKRSAHIHAFMIGAAAVLVTGCLPYPRLVYDFDDGTTQGWSVSGSVHDDQGKSYSPPLFTALHFEAAQYPGSFPGGDPLKDSKGSLQIDGAQMGPWALTSGFPNSTSYWAISAHRSGLDAYQSNAWQGIQGVSAAIGDVYGATPGHVTANLGVRARVGNQDLLIREVDATGKPVFHPVSHASTYKWTHVNSKLNIPPGASVYMVFIEFHGDWKNYHTYEGAILVDSVAPIK